jgi:hypothetical protein
VAAITHVARVPLLLLYDPLLVRIRRLLLISTACGSFVLLTYTRTHCKTSASPAYRSYSLPTSCVYPLAARPFADVHAYALEVIRIAYLPLVRIRCLLLVCIHGLLLVRFVDLHAHALEDIPIACLPLVRIQRLLHVFIHRLLLVRFADLHAYALEDIPIACLPPVRIQRLLRV